MFNIFLAVIFLSADGSGHAGSGERTPEDAATARARPAAFPAEAASPATQSPAAGTPPLPAPPAPDSVPLQTTEVGLHQESTGWIRETRYVRRRGGEWTLSSDSLQARPPEQ